MSIIHKPMAGEFIWHVGADVYCPACHKVTPHSFSLIHDEDGDLKTYTNLFAVAVVCQRRKRTKTSWETGTYREWTCGRKHSIWVTREGWHLMLGGRKDTDWGSPNGGDHVRRC